MTTVKRPLLKGSEDETTVDFDTTDAGFFETGQRAKPVTKFCAECGAGISNKKTYCQPCAAERMPHLGSLDAKRIGMIPKPPKVRKRKVTKKSAAPRVPKNKVSKRTSMWLANDLRRQLDTRARNDRRSLAQTIDFYLRKGLGKPAKDEANAASAPIFG